jgi:biopolymer transport protein ExbD
MTPSTGKDATLNLVPFIDLLSTCIAFLLITAVWSQSAQVPAQTAGGGDGEASRVFHLIVALDGCTLTSPAGAVETVDNAGLAGRLRALGVGEELQVSGADRVPYDVWIRALDAARSAGVTRLAVALDG